MAFYAGYMREKSPTNVGGRGMFSTRLFEREMQFTRQTRIPGGNEEMLPAAWNGTSRFCV